MCSAGARAVSPRRSHSKQRALASLGAVVFFACNEATFTPSDFVCATIEETAQLPPKPIFLFFADGKTPIPGGRTCRGESIPPAFVCPYVRNGDAASCHREIAGFLQRWYRDFNVYFSTTQPAGGDFMTIVVTSGSSWCGTDLHGEAPNSCHPLKGGVGFAFKCHYSAKDCAALIAHEHGHLMGLAHEESDLSLMQSEDCGGCDSFPNADITVPEKRCRRELQNSYKWLCEHLGPRSSVPLPADALTCVDTAAPNLTITSPPSNTAVREGFTVEVDAGDECGVRRVYTRAPENGPTDLEPPYRLTSDLPEGPGRLTVFAEDNHGRIASASIGVVVHPRECPRFPCHVAEPL